jgi:hypothetical protein
VSGVFHFRIGCTECRKKLKGRQVFELKRAAGYLDGCYESEFARLLSDVKTVLTSYRSSMVSGKMRNLGIVSMGQRAVCIRRLRANFERAKIVSLTK